MAKKRLKKILPLIAAGVGAAMLGRRGRPLGVSGSNKSLFTSNNAMRNSMLQNSPVTQQELMDFGKDQGPGFELMAKDGGKIVKGERTAVRTKKKKVGIQIKGFGKARTR
tara:strand:+ start:35 stop:364 length:330 start_codon:yes stop_codon:yes gene_type:complete